MTYMYHGYNKYRERVSSIMSSQNVSKEEIIPEILDKVGKSIATAYAYARGALNRHDLEEIQGGTKKVMGAMADVVRLIAPNSDQLNINVNFMLKVPEPPSDVPPEFMIHKKESYSSFLLLIRYDNGNGFRICLPLESSTKTNYSLPNAPACFAEGEPKLLNKNKIKFQNKVPKDVQEQVRKFFSESKYESVLSLPLCLAQGSNESIGVVNIESNRIDIIGNGSKQTLRIANSLAPLCLILATLAEAERKML
ncbi:hypothetical protein [Novacetimonas maltaceti]|nr:hypothetical protein [Novacetimonas maltaceti]